MARKEVLGKSEIEKYRKRLGKHEFTGRNKRHTIKTKDAAQARKSSSPFSIILLYLVFLLVVLIAIYCLFYSMMKKETN